MEASEERLRRLAINDERYLDTILGRGTATNPDDRLDPRAAAYVRIGAAIALGASATVFEWVTAGALNAGATPDDIVDVLDATAPLVGAALVVSAAPKLALALGFDIEVELYAGGEGRQP